MRNILLVTFAIAASGLCAEDVDALIKKLSESDIAIQVEAATALGKAGNSASAAVPALITALKKTYKVSPAKQGEYSELHKAVVNALALIGPGSKDATPILEYEVKHRGSLPAVIALSKIVPERLSDINEMLAVFWCKQYLDSQAQYFVQKKEFAQSLKGDSGLENLVWYGFSNADGDLPASKPLRNYCFRILKAQGDRVVEGKKSYIVNGKMTAGVALVAYPIEYGQDGKKTFVIGSVKGEKKLYSKDFGTESAKIGKAMSEFNPDDSWKEEDAAWGLGPASAKELQP